MNNKFKTYSINEAWRAMKDLDVYGSRVKLTGTRLERLDKFLKDIVNESKQLKEGKVDNVYKDDKTKQCAFENALDCLYYGSSRSHWNSCGLSKEEADEVWKKAIDFSANADESLKETKDKKKVCPKCGKEPCECKKEVKEAIEEDTFYVVISQQGYDELVVRVKAKDKEEARLKACQTYMLKYEVVTYDEKPDLSKMDCLYVDEDGDELDLNESLKERRIKRLRENRRKLFRK